MGFLKKIIKLSFITIIAIIIISIVGEIVIVGKKAFEHSILGTELENDNFIQNTKQKDIEKLVLSNNLKISNRIVNAILLASERYQIDALDLTVIGIIETGLGKYTKTMINSNGTKDRGLFQINSVNWPKCVEYNLDSPEGSSFCAAKLLSEIKKKHKDYLGRYHSRTPSKKASYLKKMSKILSAKM